MPPSEAGLKALQHLEHALAKRPEKDGYLLSAALRCLADYRDGVVAAHRAAPDGRFDKVLANLNGAISAVMAVQYPLGEEPWSLLEKARDWLVGVLGANTLRAGEADASLSTQS